MRSLQLSLLLNFVTILCLCIQFVFIQTFYQVLLLKIQFTCALLCCLVMHATLYLQHFEWPATRIYIKLHHSYSSLS